MSGPSSRLGNVGLIHGASQDNRTYAHDSQGTTFAFRKRWGQIDWRSLAAVDVDRIAREMDFQSLQQNIMNITFCNIESEGFHNVDSNFVKLFKLAQLIIEYLLHCQQYLSEQGSNLEQRVHEIQTELENAKTELSSQTAELKTVRKENKKRKKIIQAYQDMMNAGATGIHTCPVCNREFVSKEYLQAHIHRRHPDYLSHSEKENSKKQASEELEKRLMEQMTERLRLTETQLREDVERKELESLENHKKEFEEWKAKEQDKMKVELFEFKEPIVTELRAVQNEKAQLEENLLQKQAEIEALASKKQSHLGHLEGAQELDIDGSKKTNMDLQQLNEQLETKLQEMHSSMKKEEKSWQKRMQTMSTSYQDQIIESKEKLHSLERSLLETSQSKQKDKTLTTQLSSLKKNMQEQKKQLQSQEQKLTVLQARDYTPSPPPTGVLRVSEHPPQDESLSEVTTEYSDQDEVDFPSFYTPLAHRPTIKTKFNHDPEVLEDIKKETQSILADALLQRGFPKNTSSLSNSEFSAKTKNLEQERQQRVQTHYNFQDHRERLVEMVEGIAKSEFSYEPSMDALSHVRPRKKKKKERGTAQSPDLAVSLPGTSKSKPPKPTSSRLSTTQPVNSGAPTPDPITTRLNHPPTNDKVSVSTVKPALEIESAYHELSDEKSDEENASSQSVASLSSLTTTTSSSRFDPSSPAPPPTTTPTSRYDPPPNQAPPHTATPTSKHNPLNSASRNTANAQTKQKDTPEDDSPWDSDDSIEELIAGGRASSTPIKGGGGGMTNPVKKITWQQGNINIEPNASKQPPGGVPLFQVTPANLSQVHNDDDDSFDISEPSLPIASSVATSSNRRKTNLKSPAWLTDTLPPASHTGTSRSPLTTVSLEDFADSDFSDLDL